MPLPPDIDPLGLSYAEGPFDDAPPWPPPEWYEQQPDLTAPPVVDEIPGAPVPEQQPLSPLDDPFAPTPLTDEFAGAPDPFAPVPEQPQPMPWETQPGELEPAFPTEQQPGVRDIPGLSFYEHRQRATPQPPSYLAPGDPSAPLPSMREEQVIDPFAGLTDEQGFTAARRLPPEQLLELEGQRAYLQQKKALVDQARIEDENLAAIDANRKMRADAAARADADTQQIISDASALAEKGIDRKGWFSKLDTVGKIGAVVGALTGGLMSKAGGPNHGIDFIDKLVNADIEDQKYQIEQKRDVLKMRQGAVAQAYQRTGDMYMAQETARLATYNALVNKMKTEQQNFDPRGTMFLNHGKAIQQMQARAAQAEQKIRQQRFENNIKQGEFDLKQKEFALKQTRTAAAAGAAKAGVLTPTQLRERYPDGAPIPPVPMTEKEYGQWLANKERGADVAKKELAVAPSERARELGVPGIVDDKGEQVLFRDAKTAGEIADVKGKVQTATRLVDQMIAAREKYGWSSNLFKSPEWRQIQSDYTNAQLVAKDIYGLGVITGPDLGLIEKAMGTSDPTEVRDPIPGLKSSRANMINRVNDAIGAQAAIGEGRKLQRWEPPKLALPEAKATEEQKLLAADSKETLAGLTQSLVDERVATDRRAGIDVESAEYHPQFTKHAMAATAEARQGFDPRASLAQRTRLDELTVKARSGDADARKELEHQANTSDSPGVRELAKYALELVDLQKQEHSGPRSIQVTVPDAFRLDGVP